MDDRTLIKKCLEKNRLAQKEFFERYCDKFFAMLLRYVGNVDDAKDLLQESFIIIFARLKDFKFQGSLEGWGRKVVSNTAINYLRKKREFVLSYSNLVEETFENVKNRYCPGWENLEEKYFKETLEDYILKCVSELHPSRRKAFTMYVIEGYTHKEISKMLNISESTSKANLCRANEKLRKKIKEYYKI